MNNILMEALRALREDAKKAVCDYCGSSENVHYNGEHGYVCDKCLHDGEAEVPGNDVIDEPSDLLNGLTLKEFVFETNTLEDGADRAGVELSPENFYLIADQMQEEVFESCGEEFDSALFLNIIKDIGNA